MYEDVVNRQLNSTCKSDNGFFHIPFRFPFTYRVPRTSYLFPPIDSSFKYFFRPQLTSHSFDHLLPCRLVRHIYICSKAHSSHHVSSSVILALRPSYFLCSSKALSDFLSPGHLACPQRHFPCPYLEKQSRCHNFFYRLYQSCGQFLQ